MRQTYSRDGRRRRERADEPSYLTDSEGNRRHPPKLGEVPVSFEAAEKGANLDFFIEWEGARHRFHSTTHCQPGNVKHTDMLVLRAAAKYALLAYGQGDVQKNKRLEERDMVRFIYRLWRRSNDWNGAMEEAWNLIEVRKIMES